MPIQWRKAIVENIKDLTPNVKSFLLKTEVFDDFTFEEGQFLTFDLPIGSKRLERWRSYSIASSPSPIIELCISKVEGGRASTYFFEDVTIGTELQYKGPEGTFVFPKEDVEEVIMICTGTGIAPFRSMLLGKGKEFLKSRKITLLFGCRTQKDLIYRKELEQLSHEFPTFQYIPTLSRENWEGEKGYVHEWYKKYATDINISRVFMLCGWSKMVDEAKTNLQLMGYDSKQILVELYG